MQVFQTQISDPKEWAGLTTQNHLGWLGMHKPHMLNDVIRTIYKYGSSGDDFVNLVNTFPTVTVPNDTVPHRWMFAGATEKNVPLVGASVSLSAAQAGTYITTSNSPTTQLGYGGQHFFMVFNERYFSNREVIVGSRPMAFSLRIMAEPISNGSKWIYEVALFGARYGADFFVPIEDIAAGTRWSADFTPTAQTLSRGGSEPKYNSYYMLENYTSMIRKQLTCAGNMITAGGNNDPLMFKFATNTEGGKVETKSLWIDYQMWKFIQAFRADYARLLLFGRSTVNPETGTVNMKDPDSGYDIKAGLGFYEQISSSSTYKYTDFSLRTLESILMELSYNKKAMDDRHFILMTGEYGAMQFYKAARNEAAAVPFMLNNQLLNYKGDGMGSFKVGSINEYMWYNGIKVTVMVDPSKDNAVRNSAIHPDGGLMSSYEYDIVDAGSKDGNANIKRIAVAGYNDTFGYIAGLRTPFKPGAPMNSPNLIASSIDGYEIHGAMWGGLTIEDPSKVARMVPAFLY